MRLDPLDAFKLGVGARGQALGGAFTALADDGTAAFWNPAGVVMPGPKEFEVTLSVLPMDLGRTRTFFGYLQNLGKELGTLGISWDLYRLTSIETRAEDGGLLGSQEDQQNTFSLTYGLKLSGGWKAGIDLKYYLHQLAGETGQGWGLDLGTQFQPSGDWLRWRFGASVQDLSLGMHWTTRTNETITPRARLGAGYHLVYDQLIASLDLEWTHLQKVILHAGLEWWAWDGLALRTGMDTQTFSLGAGCKLPDYQFDYSFSLLFEGLSPEHRMTVMVRI